MRHVQTVPAMLFFAVATLFGWAPHLMADGDERRMTYSEMYSKGRPAGFYESGFSADAKACRAVLHLLNRPVAIPPGLRIGYNYAEIDTLFLLHTSANVSWEAKWLNFYKSKTRGAGWLDAATADIFNNGRPLRLFRLKGSVSSNYFHSFYATPIERVRDYIVESDDRIDGLPVATLRVPVYELQAIMLDFDLGFAVKELGTTKTPWAGVFADIVEIDGGTYVLVTSAIEEYRRGRAYLLKFSSYKDREVVCEFKSRYVFINE